MREGRLLPLLRVGREQIVQRRGVLRVLDVSDRLGLAAPEHVAIELRAAKQAFGDIADGFQTLEPQLRGTLMNKRILSVFLIGIASLGISSWTTGTAYGRLLAVDYDTGNLYTVSTANAALTLVGNTGAFGFGEIEFSPSGTLYGFSTGSAPTLYKINPSTAWT